MSAIACGSLVRTRGSLAYVNHLYGVRSGLQQGAVRVELHDDAAFVSAIKVHYHSRTVVASHHSLLEQHGRLAVFRRRAVLRRSTGSHRRLEPLTGRHRGFLSWLRFRFNFFLHSPCRRNVAKDSIRLPFFLR